MKSLEQSLIESLEDLMRMTLKLKLGVSPMKEEVMTISCPNCKTELTFTTQKPMVYCGHCGIKFSTGK